MKSSEKINILERNVTELQEQLQVSYAKIADMTQELSAVRNERDTLIHHHMAELEIIRKEITNKKSLTQCIQDAMTSNIKMFQTILGKLKGV
jgi:hypothetical protein|tara:strand:+ start:822 stop:1097 length:276 start_codon:yes stop_codon:yes gene_type:complete